MNDRLQGFVRTMPPGYFALVMASGIVSVGLAQEGFLVASRVLFGVAIAAHLGFIVLTGWRLLRHRADLVADLRDPRRAFGFFTFVAGTNVIGVRTAGADQPDIALVLLVIAAGVGVLLGYLVPWLAVLGREERPVIATANGTWFVWVVASQSVAVLASALEPIYPTWRAGLAIVAVMAWSVGVILYAATAVFVSLRMMLYPLRPIDLDPPYWVAMGAVAITVVAGARIVEMDSTPMVDATRGLVAGLSVVFWCFATWLIPVLVAAGIWRHLVRRIPLRYESTLWSVVFPLGMYAVAGIYLGRADRLPIVERIGQAWLWVGVLAWLLTAVAMVISLVRRPASSATEFQVTRSRSAD
ncbi:MAG: tellurite resistance/C4-dicarboxylate transporter family protein [Propionibacteriaceae bacterium]